MCLFKIGFYFEPFMAYILVIITDWFNKLLNLSRMTVLFCYLSHISETGIGEVNSSHYMILIDYPRARNVAQWYEEAFGAELLHEQVNAVGVSNGIRLPGTYYLRIGPVGCCAILEIRDLINDSIDDVNREELKWVTVVSFTF